MPHMNPEDLENWVLNMSRFDRTGDDEWANYFCMLLPVNKAIDVVPTIGDSTCHPLVLTYDFDYYYCPPDEGLPPPPPPEPPNPDSCPPPALDYPLNNHCGDNACIDCGWTFPLGVCHRIHFKIVITEKA